MEKEGLTLAQENVQLIVFSLGEEEYALEINHVQEINRLLPVTRVPRAPLFIEGVINLRGNIIPVINLHARIGLSKRTATKNTRIIIALIGGLQVGLIVDGVTEVLRLSRNNFELPENIGGVLPTTYLKAIGKTEGRMILLINIETLLDIDQLLLHAV